MEIESTSLKLLLKYDALAAGYAAKGAIEPRKLQYIQDHGTTPQDFARMKECGIAFDPISLKHDTAVSICFEAYANCTKRHVTDLFLASFSSGRADWRAGLSAYAIMQTMPKHAFDKTAAGFCSVCSGAEMVKRLDLTELNRERFSYGSMSLFRTPYEVQFFLKQHRLLDPVLPTSDDIDLFNRILHFVRSADSNKKPSDLAKDLRKLTGFSSSLEQTRGLLETLGFCGILRTAEHEGYLTKYTNPGLAPSKSHSSGWAYPMDFWVGSDGVNQEALRFWFGDYEGIGQIV